MDVPHKLKLRVVSSGKEFKALKPVWNGLLEKCDCDSPFLTWEWMYNWWLIYSTSSAKLIILVIYDGAMPVAIAPFYLKFNYFLVPRRSIYFLGTGEPENMEVFSEYLDIIILQHYSDKVLVEISNYLSKDFIKWDKLEFLRVLDSSYIGCLRLLTTGSFKRLRIKSVCGYRYIVKLPKTWQEYLSSLKSSMRRSVNKAESVVSSDHNFTYERVVDKDDVTDIMVNLAQLHTESWNKKGKPGAFVSPEFCEFHRRIAEKFAQNGMLDLLVIRYRDEVIAMLYNFKTRSTIFYYQSAFNMHQYSKISPGVLAHSQRIKYAIEDSYGSYDLMMGGSNSYKSRYGTVKQEMNNVIFYNNSIIGCLMSLVFKLCNK